jgi:hypothetical protein
MYKLLLIYYTSLSYLTTTADQSISQPPAFYAATILFDVHFPTLSIEKIKAVAPPRGTSTYSARSQTR